MDIPKSVRLVFAVTGPMYLLLVFVVYVWVDVMLGATLTLFTVVIVGGVLLTRDWAKNDYFVSAKYVTSIFMIHVGCTRCVTSSTDNIMKIRARITLTVEVIRTCIFIF
jgi:hypothetical protein